MSAGVSCLIRRNDIRVDGERRSVGAVRNSLACDSVPEHSQAMAQVEGQPIERTEQRIKREERVGQIESVPDTRAEERALDEVEAIADRSVQAEFIQKIFGGGYCFPYGAILVRGHEPFAEAQNVRDLRMIAIEALCLHWLQDHSQEDPGKEG